MCCMRVCVCVCVCEHISLHAVCMVAYHWVGWAWDCLASLNVISLEVVESAVNKNTDVTNSFVYSISDWLGLNSALGWLSCLMQHHGFSPPLRRIFPVEGTFPLELTWVLTPFPQNSFMWEYKLRSRLCTYAFHRMDTEDPGIHVLDRWMSATKTHPACSIHEDGMWLPEWLDWKTVTYAKISPKNGESRDKAREQEGWLIYSYCAIKLWLWQILWLAVMVIDCATVQHFCAVIVIAWLESMNSVFIYHMGCLSVVYTFRLSFFMAYA